MSLCVRDGLTKLAGRRKSASRGGPLLLWDLRDGSKLQVSSGNEALSRGQSIAHQSVDEPGTRGRPDLASQRHHGQEELPDCQKYQHVRLGRRRTLMLPKISSRTLFKSSETVTSFVLGLLEQGRKHHLWQRDPNTHGSNVLWQKMVDALSTHCRLSKNAHFYISSTFHVFLVGCNPRL